MKLAVRNNMKYMNFLVVFLLLFVSCSNIKIHNKSDKIIWVSALGVRSNYMVGMSSDMHRDKCVKVDLPKSQLKGGLYDSFAVLFYDGSSIRAENIKIHNNDSIYVHDNAIYVNEKLYETRSERWKSNL